MQRRKGAAKRAAAASGGAAGPAAEPEPQPDDEEDTSTRGKVSSNALCWAAWGDGEARRGYRAAGLS
jgi:hypothetical protein